MTEEHKQKIRDAHARRAAERREAAAPEPVAVITGGDIDALKTEEGARRFTGPEPVITRFTDEELRTHLSEMRDFTPFGPGDHTDHLTPHQSFCVWLKSKPGIDASDPRLPSDYARQCVEIEDRLRTAFNAGFVAGKGGVA